MVRKYIKKSQRKLWSADAMKMAMEAVLEQNYSVRRASIEHHVPQATLARKINQVRSEPGKDIDSIANPYGSNFQTVFTKEQETILCQFIHTLEDQFVPLSTMDIRRLAYQVAEKFDIPHRFNKDSALAGEDWYRGFIKRNPEICIKRTDSLEKVKGMRKDKVYKFFDLMESIVNEHQLEASDIYNLDETVITCLSKKSIVNSSDRHTEQSEDSGQSKLVTATVCFSASGSYAPLMLIFPSKTKNIDLLKNAPPGAWAEYDQSGQMQLNIFINWLKKFISFSKASKDSQVLLIVDGYRSYLKDLQVLELAKENGINVLCLPPYCTKKLQPMQQDFMKSLSTAYTTQVTNWLHDNPGCQVSMEEVYQLFGNAFMKISTIASPVDGFRSTGIWPADRDRFEDEFIEISKGGIAIVNDKLESSLNKSKSNEEVFPVSIANNAYVNNRETTVVSKSIVHEPIVVITQGHNQPYVIQSLGTINQENEHFLQQGFVQQPFNQAQIIQHYSVMEQQHTDSVQIENINLDIQEVTSNDTEDQISPAVIPPEAQLTEVRIEDLQNLIQSQRKLHFYVSPYRLALSK